MSKIEIKGVLGKSGDVDVFLGFASARLLFELSKSDVLDEMTGKGYQRRFNEQHSLDFRRYIQRPTSTTIPLTFNLRKKRGSEWRIEQNSNMAILSLDSSRKELYRVDCQHRLGHLSDLEVILPFMTYIGLSAKSEMTVFSTINGKAKGLSSSLLDVHEARLTKDLGRERPELYIALKLQEDELSPWYQRLDLGGNNTSGMKRRASLRTMQKAIKRFVIESKAMNSDDVDAAYYSIRAFWTAISVVLSSQWDDPRKHLITKGIGVYTLSSIAAELYKDAKRESKNVNKDFYCERLSDFILDIDWSNSGDLKGLGGVGGVRHALDLLLRKKHRSELNKRRLAQGGK
jgi:DNA sulfur modification protein DndB